MAEQLFEQADTNHDQRLDFNEFRNLIAQNLGPNASVYGGDMTDAGQFTTSSYQSSNSFADNSVIYNEMGGINMSDMQSYEQTSSYSPTIGVATGDATGIMANASVTAQGSASSSSVEVNNVQLQQQQQQQQLQYPTNAQGLFQDPNPQIVRRPAPEGPLTYTQNIKIRFLQPPAIPPPGPLIIKEVRPPQPPPPPPLVVRQRAPPLPQPAPLILRERPPPIPVSVGAQTVIRKLPPLPIPPRSVIIERLPALPPRPRDIIIERWIPYSAMTQRKTIVQRAEPAKEYPKPRNVIIQYEPPQIRVVRQFQRLGVTPENPQAYFQRYGASLFDSQTLVQQARAAGVIEDISPPANLTASSFNNESNINTARTSASSASFGSQQGGGDFAGEYLSNYTNGSAYDNYQTTNGAAAVNGNGNIDVSKTVFNLVDTNKDGSIDGNEFRQFLNSQI